MVRDGLTNIVSRLQDRGLDPRKVGHSAWESRCPAHRSLDHALSITRNEFNHVVLACRGIENCQHTAIVRALGFTNDHLYAETPDWLISKLRQVAVQPSTFATARDARDLDGSSLVAAEGAHGLAEVSSPFEEKPDAPAIGRRANGSQPTTASTRDTGTLADVSTASEGARVTSALPPEEHPEVTTPPVRFRRPVGQFELPMPARGGSLELLKKYVNVEAVDWPLFIGWLTAAVRPIGPHPILVLTGEQGAAKTTMLRVCRRLIDPNVSPVRSQPKELRDLMIAAPQELADGI
jgi:hypothetical protein